MESFIEFKKFSLLLFCMFVSVFLRKNVMKSFEDIFIYCGFL